MKSNPTVWMLTVSYSGNVAMVCLSDVQYEIDLYAAMVPTDDEAWTIDIHEHNTGISPNAAAVFRRMAQDGIAFVGRHAQLLGIATDFNATIQ